MPLLLAHIGTVIPKLIHQTAKTSDIPEAWRGYQSKVQELHPDWHYHLWTDEENLQLVSTQFPELLDAFMAMPKPIMRVDVIRYLIVYRLGGLYLDLDYEMLKPFDLERYDCVLPLEIARDQYGHPRVGNAFFAAAPGHPFFRLVLDDLRDHPPLDPNADVLSATGPEFLSRVLRQYPSANPPVCTPPRELFSPQTPRNAREYRSILRRGTAYGIHHCHGTWREYSLPRRMRNRLASGVRKLM